MTFVRWRFESFTLEYMTEMTTARGASDLYAGHTIGCIFVSGDGPWDGIEERGPTTTTRELCVALVERCATSSARINPRFLVVFVLPSARAFCTLLTQNLELLWGQDGPPLRLRLLLGFVGHGSREGDC